MGCVGGGRCRTYSFISDNTTEHYIIVDQIILNKKKSVAEFTLNAEDSYLLIQRVYVTSKVDTGNQWANFITKVKLTAELKYVVFDRLEGRFIDERKKRFPIHLRAEPRQIQPVFHLNKLIKNEAFTVGIDPERKFYRTLELALQDVENLCEDYDLELNIEKYKTND